MYRNALLCTSPGCAMAPSWRCCRWSRIRAFEVGGVFCLVGRACTCAQYLKVGLGGAYRGRVASGGGCCWGLPWSAAPLPGGPTSIVGPLIIMRSHTHQLPHTSAHMPSFFCKSPSAWALDFADSVSFEVVMAKAEWGRRAVQARCRRCVRGGKVWSSQRQRVATRWAPAWTRRGESSCLTARATCTTTPAIGDLASTL